MTKYVIVGQEYQRQYGYEEVYQPCYIDGMDYGDVCEKLVSHVYCTSPLVIFKKTITGDERAISE